MIERKEILPLNFARDFSSITIDGETMSMEEYRRRHERKKQEKDKKYKIGDVVTLIRTNRKVRIMKIDYINDIGKFDYAGIDINEQSSDDMIYPFNEDWIQEEQQGIERDL